jgi:hypothetical protein
MPPEQPAPSSYPHPAYSNSHTRLLLAACAIVLLLIIAAFGYWWHAMHGAPAQALPLELRTAVFFSAPPESAVYGATQDGVVAISPSSVFVNAAARGARHVAFVYSTKLDQYVLSVDGVAVATSTKPMQGLSLSPDGTSVALAMQRTGAFGSTQSSDWHTVVYTIATKKAKDIGVGFSPYFLGDAHLLSFAPTGVMFVDLGTGARILETNAPFASTETRTYLSPDRKSLGWSLADGKTLLFHITHVSPPKLELDQHALKAEAITFGNGAFYEMRQNHGRSEVWKRTAPSEAPVRIYTFPNGMDIRRIAF